MSEQTRFFGLLALPVFLLAACAPEGQDRTTTGGAEADAAEAPPTQRPTTTTQPAFTEWDMNADGTLDAEEFGRWADDEGHFDGWFSDTGVDLQAIYSDLHSAMDMNSDGSVDQNDWNATIQNLFGNEDPGQWSEWDTDGDGELSEEEFALGLEARGFRERLDQDGDSNVTEAEVRDFFFDLMDRNGDGRLDTTEWNSGRETWFGDDGMSGMM